MDNETNKDQLIVVAAVIADKKGRLLLLKRKADEKRAPGIVKWLNFCWQKALMCTSEIMMMRHLYILQHILGMRM